MKDEIHVEINRVRMAYIENKLRPMIEKYGEDSVMKCLAQMIDDMNVVKTSTETISNEKYIVT